MHDWLVVWNIFYFFHMLGMSSSQLLLTPSFFRGVGYSTNQMILHVILWGCYLHPVVAMVGRASPTAEKWVNTMVYHGLPWCIGHRHGWFIFQFMVIYSIMVIYYHYSEDKNLWNIHITKTYFMAIYSTLPWSWMILKFAGELSLSRHSAALNKPWRWAKRPTQWLRNDAESGCLLVNEQFANWNIHTFYRFLAGKSW